MSLVVKNALTGADLMGGGADLVTNQIGQELFGRNWVASPGQVGAVADVLNGQIPFATGHPLDAGPMFLEPEPTSYSSISSVVKKLLGGGSTPPPTPYLPPAIAGVIGKVAQGAGVVGAVKGAIDVGKELLGGGTKIPRIGPGTVKAPLFSNQCPPGYHLVVKKGLGLDVLARDTCVRKKRMNVLNPHALSRANRRVCGFAGKAVPVLKQLGYTVSATRSARGKLSRGRKKKGCGCK